MYGNSVMKRVFSICTSILMAFVLGIVASGWNHPAAIADSKPDLIVQNINTSPQEPAIDDTATITVTVKNQGTADASASQVVCYIDTSILATKTISSLAPGEMATASFTWQAQSGSHVIKATADSTGIIPETDETNNTLTSSLTTLVPDLIVQSISWSPTDPSNGDNIIFSITVRNQGNYRSRVTKVNLYIDGTSRGYRDVLAIDPGSTTIVDYSWITRAGQHNIQAVVDETQQVNESDESNNEYTFTFSTLPPDLIVENITWSPENPSYNDIVTYTATIKNQGTGSSDPCQLAYFIDGSFKSLLSFPAIEAGTSENITFDHLAPLDLHEIKVTIDYNDTVFESDNTNNDKTVSFLTARPDLVVTDLSWDPEDIGVGDTVTFTATIKNEGAGRANSFRVACYVGGHYGGGVDILELEDGEETTASFQWLAMNDAYGVTVTADCDTEITESNEENNKIKKDIHVILPDIYISSIAWSPEHPSIGDLVTFSVNLTNQGGGNAEGFFVDFYLDDAFLSSTFISRIPSDSSANATYTWKAQNGRHAFKAVADNNKTVVEVNENNNEMTVSIAPHMPDLAVGTVTWSPADMPLGSEVKFSIDIENLGSLNAGPSRIAYYVDGSIASFTDIDNLNAGSKITDHFLWVVADGPHTIEVVSDSSDRVIEVDEDNNTKKISIPLSDLIMPEISWSPSQASIGDNVTFTVTVKNQGASRTQTSRIDCYVDGFLLGSNDLPPINPAGSTTSSFVWVAVKGNHNIRIVADSTNQVTEVDETNNEMKTTYATCTPDLIIQNIDWLMENPLVDDEVVLTVTIKNQGGDASGPCQLTYTINDNPAVIKDIDSLPSGDLFIEVITTDLKAGSHTVEMSVDSLDEVIELDETNNEKTLAFSTVVPDLVVKMISWSPRDAAPGDSITISARVENQGREKAAKTRLSLDINGITVDSVEIGEMDIGDVVTKEFSWIAESGLQEISISADIDGLLPESNEANNTGTRTITITGDNTPADEPPPLSSGPTGDKGFLGEWWLLLMLVALLLGGAAFIFAYKAFKKE